MGRSQHATWPRPWSIVSAVVFVASGCGAPPPPVADPYAQAVAAVRRASPSEARFLATELAAVLERPDPSGWLHRAAIEALGRSGARTAAAALGRIVEAPAMSLDFFHRRLAARAIGKLGTPEAAELLTRNLTRKERDLALETDCRAGLSSLGALARPALERALSAADPDLVIAAARQLAALADARALPALHAALESDVSVGPVEKTIREAISTLDVGEAP